MLGSVRREKILEYIREKGYAKIEELSKIFNMSRSSIRRDLGIMDDKNLLTRTFGGAVLQDGKQNGNTNGLIGLTSFNEHLKIMKKEKMRIAKAAAVLVKKGDRVILDGGTTTYYIARQLMDKYIQVITNSLPILNMMSGCDNINLTVLGGTLHKATGIFLGVPSIELLKQINVEKAFIGMGGIDKDGITNVDFALVNTEKMMIEISKEVIVAGDSSKFNRKALAFISELSNIDKVITDREMPSEYHDILKKSDIELIIA